MVLVTGGAGYIGSHVVRMLIEKKYDVVIFDNLSRGHIESVPEGVTFVKVDLTDNGKLEEEIKKFSFDSILHFASFTYVGESVEHPDMYYFNNVIGGFNLINLASKYNINKFIFSSTCSVYGNPDKIPISEKESVKPINPYAKTKNIIESILSDFENAGDLKYCSLRYFNAAGCSEDGSIGESHDPEPHLIPNVLFNALGSNDKVYVYGDDYDTPDGTCIRDYIHIYDLANAHIKALEYISENKKSLTVNLGTGNGYSVKEIITAASDITGSKINYEITGRRAGDPAVLVADNNKAAAELNWRPEKNLNDIIKSAYYWFKNRKY